MLKFTQGLRFSQRRNQPNRQQQRHHPLPSHHSHYHSRQGIHGSEFHTPGTVGSLKVVDP